MDPEVEPLTGMTAGQPAWYTPKRLLALFCWLTFLIYLDQGVVASNGVNRPIQVGQLLPRCASPPVHQSAAPKRSAAASSTTKRVLCACDVYSAIAFQLCSLFVG